MTYEDVKYQLERYGGKPEKELLPILAELTGLNDDLAHLRSWGCIEERVVRLKGLLDELLDEKG